MVLLQHPARSARLALVLRGLAIVLVFLAGASAALAHATLVTAVPPDGAVLKAQPASLRLTYNEPVRVLAAAITLPDGSTSTIAPPPDDARAVEIPLPSASAPGTRAVTVRVASADGHPVATSLLFSVGAPSAGVVPPEPDDPRLDCLLWLSVTVALVALFFSGGGLFFRAATALAPPAPLVLPLAGAAALLLAGTLHKIDAIGGGLGLVATTLPWTLPDPTSFRLVVIAGLTAFAAVIAARVLDSDRVRLSIVASVLLRLALSVIAIAAAGWALSASGHAANAEPHLLTRTALVAHAVALAVWLGALPTLLIAARRGGPAFRQGLARFSMLVPTAILLLVASGSALAVVQLTTPSDLWTTGYGRVLAAKLVLVALMLGLGAWNRWRLTEPVLAGNAAATTAFRRLVGAEIVLAVLVLGVVGLFRFTPPPRALADAAAEPAYVHIHAGTAMADVTVTPGRVGTVRVTAVLLTGDFGPLPARDVTFTLTEPAGAATPVTARATLTTEGYTADGLIIEDAGRWSLRITADVDGVPLDLQDVIDIRR